MQSRARGGDDLRNMMIKDDHAGPPIPKAKGRVQAPNGADGAPCRWDEHEGCWLESDGTPYDKKAAAARKKARQRAARSAEQAQAAREADAARQQVRRDGRSTVSADEYSFRPLLLQGAQGAKNAYK